jgi:hypothetical protein
MDQLSAGRRRRLSSERFKPRRPDADDLRMRHLFMPCTFVGVGFLALWVHVRFPALEPRSLRRASIHVAFSFILFRLVPPALHPVLRTFPLPVSVAVAMSALIVPTFCYVLLSWLWLLARIRDHAASPPRGGHPVRSVSH